MAKQEKKIFTRLSKLRHFERRHLPFLKTLADFDLVVEIGAREEAGSAITVNALMQLNIAPVATMQRRLARLRMLGVVRQKRSRDDARVMHLRIRPAVRQIFERYARLV